MNSNTKISDVVNIHFFNAGKGDSIVIEFVSDTIEYVVIDSNLTKNKSRKINPAYEFLKAKNVSSISSLIISHLHMDHYNGVEYLLKEFEIQKIIIPPFLSAKSKQYNKIIDSFRRKIKSIVERTSDDDVIQYCESLTYLIHYISNNDDKVEEASGRESVLRFPGVTNSNTIVYLPLRKITGVLHKLINDHNYELNNFPSMNDSSIAICLNCFGNKILLTGDSTLAQWMEHKRQMGRDKITNLNTKFLKVPHHGSRYDNNEQLYDYLFNFNESLEKKYIFVSANGVDHPDKELFDLVKKFKLNPYCTNLSKFCLPPHVLRFKPLSDIPASMRAFLLNYAEKMPIECQGNIHLSIRDAEISITTSTGRPCVYRDDE